MSNEPPIAPPRRQPSRGFYTWATLAAVIIVFAGFARSYYLKGMFGAPALTTLVHVHGVVMTLWFTLFFVQVRLVASRRVDLHRTLGLAGGVLAAAVVGVGTMTAITAARLGVSPGPPALVFLTVPLGDMVVFATLIALGLAYRRRVQIHKRLLLVGTVGILGAAIARIPVDFIRDGGPLMYFGLTDLCIAICLAIDTAKNRRLHPAFGWGLLFVAATQAFRLWLGGTPGWLDFAKWLVG